jgi:MFS family permease
MSRSTLDARSVSGAGRLRQPLRGRAQGLYYGWWIVAASAGIQLLQAGLMQQAYGAYVSVLRDDMGWSTTALAFGYSLQPVQNGLLGPVQGWMIDRWGPRPVMRVGMLLFGGGLLAFSQIDTLLTFYIAFVTMAVGASLAGFMSIMTTLVQWFERRRATAMSIAQTGMSAGGMLVPLVAFSLSTLGWRATAFISGLIVLGVGLPLTQIIRADPEAYGLLPDGASPEDAQAAALVHPATGVAIERVSFTPRQALRTRAFWFISFGHGMALLVVSAVMVHLILHLQDERGCSLSQAAAVVSVMTLVTALGQLGGGYLGDRFDKRKIAALAMFGHAAGLLALAWGGAFIWVVFFILAHGTAWGMRGPLMQAMRADYFGRRHFGTIMGYSSLVIMFGMVLGPLIAGYMADRFGNYQYGFTVLATLAALGSIFFVLATPPAPPLAVERTHAEPARATRGLRRVRPA